MPSTTDSARTAIMDALAEHGEWDRLSHAQRTASNDPYPPSVAAARPGTTHRDQKVGWGMIVVSGTAVSGTVVVFAFPAASLGWTDGGLAVASLPITLPLVGPGMRKLVYAGKAEQLFEVLRRADRAPETVPDPAVAEVA